MTCKESKKLKIGDIVVVSDGVKGEVTDTGYNAVGFKWEDSQVGHIHHDDMQECCSTGRRRRVIPKTPI